MKQKFFLSLNVKILLIMLFVFAGMSALFLSVFMTSYVDQIEREVALSRKKAERIWEMFEENNWLRQNLKEEYLTNIQHIVSSETPETITSQADTPPWMNAEDRFFQMRGDLIQDLKGVRERDEKMDTLGYVVFLSLFLVISALLVLWIVMRRWILSPVEELLKATNEISQGNLKARILQKAKHSKQDELDLLASDFNKMAENIEDSVEKIERSRAFLQKLIDTIPDGVRVIDENFNIVLVNEAYATLHASMAPLLSKKCYAVTLGSDHPCASDDNPCPFLMLKNKDFSPIKVIQRYIDDAGKEKYAEVSCAVLSFSPDADKDVRLIVEVFRSLERDIVFSHQQKLSSLGMLASSVAHEMRNPLGSVHLILENIMDKEETKPLPPQELKRYLGLIHEQMTFCIDVTSRLLKMSRNTEDVRSPTDWNEVVCETSALLEYEAKKRGIEVRILTSSVPAVIEASDSELRMATVNVMQNAFHAMKDGGVLEISVIASNEVISVSFKDSGCGISAEHLHHIFEPFFSKSSDADGTGLGLVITKNVIEKFGGEISVESTVGAGTTFTFLFRKKQ